MSVRIPNASALMHHIAVLNAHGIPFTVRTVDEDGGFGSSREYAVELHDTERRAVIEPWPAPETMV